MKFVPVIAGSRNPKSAPGNPKRVSVAGQEFDSITEAGRHFFPVSSQNVAIRKVKRMPGFSFIDSTVPPGTPRLTPGFLTVDTTDRGDE